jgi:hypothetical protein
MRWFLATLLTFIKRFEAIKRGGTVTTIFQINLPTLSLAGANPWFASFEYICSPLRNRTTPFLVMLQPKDDLNRFHYLESQCVKN